MTLTPHSAAVSGLPEAEVIRETAQEVIQRPEYRLEPSVDTTPLLLRLFLQILEWILTPFKWLFESLEGIPEPLRWVVVIALAVVLAVLVTHIVYTLFAAMRLPQRKGAAKFGKQTAELSPEQLESEAETAVAREDYILAVRLLFRASMLRLQSKAKRRFRPGMTNREYLRRYRKTGVFEELQLFVDTIDVAWYGTSPCTADDYARCHSAHREIRAFAAEGTDG